MDMSSVSQEELASHPPLIYSIMNKMVWVGDYGTLIEELNV